MEMFLILIAILAVGFVLSKLSPKEKKEPGGNCKICPEYRYCGGGRPRCARRMDTTVKKHR